MVTFEMKSESGFEIGFQYSRCRYHRRGRKTYRTWWSNGQKRYEDYQINGKEHRLNGPSSTSWYEDGQKEHQGYKTNGIYHRLNGPYDISWNLCGDISYEEYDDDLP